MSNPFEALYKPYPSEREIFGTHWCGRLNYEHARDTLVASYDTPDDGDGQPVEVWCCALPARFYIIRALAGGRKGDGTPRAPFEMSTGSGMAQLAHDMALAISRGMLGLKKVGDQ